MNVLALSPHTDDIELGCGGYISKLSKNHNIYVLLFSYVYYDKEHNTPVDNLSAEFEQAMQILGVTSIDKRVFHTRRFPEYRQDILDTILIIKNKIKPSLVLAPSSNDIHQDHKVVYEETLRACKDCTVLGYELPWNCTKNTNINYFVSLEEEHINTKMKSLGCYSSQEDKMYFKNNYMQNLARVRGGQIEKEYAEGYEVIRVVK